MFGTSRADKLLMQRTVENVRVQLDGLLGIQHEDYGTGIQLVMVEGKAFESEWVYAYILGWLEGFCRGSGLSEKLWQKTIKFGLQEANSWMSELYKSHRKKINWLKVVRKKGATSNFNEGHIEGLREGSETGREIRSWLKEGRFPSSDKVLFNRLGVKMRQGNFHSVRMLWAEAESGDKTARYLVKNVKKP